MRKKKVKENKLIHLILVFFIGSFIGWIWEGLIQIYRRGIFINRGFLHGPWIPLYGFGAVIAILIGYKYRNKPIIQFILIMLIASILEYLTSYTLEKIYNITWWTYYHYPLNLNGRICLRGALLFGTMGSLFIYLIDPLITKITPKINHKLLLIICTIFSLLISIDTVYSITIPRTGKGIATIIKK